MSLYFFMLSLGKVNSGRWYKRGIFFYFFYGICIRFIYKVYNGVRGWRFYLVFLDKFYIFGGEVFGVIRRGRGKEGLFF